MNLQPQLIKQVEDNGIVLFLDFDGATHGEPCRESEYFSQLPLIEAVLREFPNVEIVISSSWRMEHSLAQMVAHFSQDIGARVVGRTDSIKKPGPNWTPGVPKHEREWECMQWLELNRSRRTPWVAIDDRANWFSPGCRSLVVTDKRTGFVEADATILRDLLAERS